MAKLRIIVERIDLIRNELILRTGTKTATFKMDNVPKDVLSLVGKTIELSDHAMYHGMEMIAWQIEGKPYSMLDFMVSSIKDVFDEEEHSVGG